VHELKTVRRMTHDGQPALNIEILHRDGDTVEAPSTWPVYRKTALTHAMRMEGPFTVLTSEGPLTCEDGYLAVDARGYPYPIAADEFDLIYQPATEGTT
jgi:hypothetical protein